jgi:DNA modification methylase
MPELTQPTPTMGRAAGCSSGPEHGAGVARPQAASTGGGDQPVTAPQVPAASASTGTGDSTVTTGIACASAGPDGGAAPTDSNPIIGRSRRTRKAPPLAGSESANSAAGSSPANSRPRPLPVAETTTSKEAVMSATTPSRVTTVDTSTTDSNTAAQHMAGMPNARKAGTRKQSNRSAGISTGSGKGPRTTTCPACERVLSGLVSPLSGACPGPVARRALAMGVPEAYAEQLVQTLGNGIDSVLLTGQAQSREQRKGRYLPESIDHPGKMLPEIARYIIAKYTRVGDWVGDPMAGIATTIVEAMLAGRYGFGVEYESRWAHLGAANIAHARDLGATGDGDIVCGDGRHIDVLVPSQLRGKFALVITSPPYGPSTHGQAMTGPSRATRKVLKVNHRYGDDKNNLAYAGHDRLADGFTDILAASGRILRPGGIVAVTARPYRRNGGLVDIPGLVIAAGQAAGLTLVDRVAALLCGVRDGKIINRGSFFQTHNARLAEADGGPPLHVTAHEDLLILAAAGGAANASVTGSRGRRSPGASDGR